ncbi:4-coumarate--CoA ligase-like 7 [Diplogelasinospora grovesii]|uniref:4-coumarate--CoA ligase-like 7 n=1 Tax=Diplogelasinospora grovesii TaxID=303347 RepID=A0AAN6NL34_9PEZI|nr:4-coumarate--CoA ligase-like 7 [Diplogelasinospora grovesii]
MTIKSRWHAPVPRCSLQQWIFGSACDSLGADGDQQSFIDPERPETNYLKLNDFRLLSKRVAVGLQEAGLKTGDRVLLFSGNNLYFPSVFLGVLMAGGVFTGANPTFVPRELAYQLRDSEANFLIVAEAAVKTAFEAAKEIGFPRDHIFVFGGKTPPAAEIARIPNPEPGTKGRVDGARHWTELLSGNLSKAERWSWAEPSDPANTTCCLNYSSGTTGVPKGVEISHHSYVANGTGVEYISKLDPEFEEKNKRARALCFLPLYHAYGQTYFIANMSRLRTPVYMMSGFDFLKMLDHVQRFRITSLACVPPIVVMLAKHPLVKKYDLSSVEAVGSGAAPLGLEVSEEAEKIIDPSGELIVRQGWGMTEMTCTAMAWDPTLRRGKGNRDSSSAGGVGEMMPGCSAKLMALDGSNSEITEAKVRGELLVSGPNMMRGYWRKPEATRETIVTDADGTRWLKTGDIAYVDDYRPGGIFHVVDRLKELIKVKGNQVAPAELEAILLEKPDITDAAVIGVTIKGEEVPRAYVVMDPKSKATPQEVADWMAGKVTRYKRLKGGVVFTDAIPKNPSGKILRKLLRERAQKEVGDSKPRTSKLS